jgi:heptosyltransferase-2
VTAEVAPRRILVRCPNWLGDVVMSTPGLRALRAAHPEARIVAHVAEPWAPLLAGHPAVDEVWPLSALGRDPRAWRAEARRIAAGDFDLGLLIPESISSALLMRAGRVGRVVGFARDRLRRALLHRVVSAPADWGRRRLVSRERFVLALMAAVGATSDDPRLELSVSEEERARLDRVWLGAGGGRRPASVVLAPGASFGPSKCWPAESFAALGDRLAERGERVVLIGTAAERARIDAVRRAMRAEPVSLAGLLDLGGLKALLREARLLVCNDAGARHVAVAFGTPVVCFFGPTAVAKTDANLDGVAILETEHGCRPCYRRRCPIDHRCLVDIGVEEALSSVDRVLRRREAEPSRQAGVGAR